MKTRVLAVSALLLVALGHPAVAQTVMSFGPPVCYRRACAVPAYPYGYPVYPYPCYPYPLPPAPSLGFGRGGIYGHVFLGRDEGVSSYTFPGSDGR